MYRLSDKESTHVIIGCSQPIAWLALSNKSGNEITEDLVKRAYATVSCRNPLLRAIHKPDVEKFSLVIRDINEIIQDEKDGKLPAHLTKEFHTREKAWAEYKRRMETVFWKCDAMWEVIVCVLDKEPVSSDTNCVIFGYFSHGVADGAAVMVALSEFIKVLNAGLTGNTLPPHNFLGESHPIPKPFLERYPAFVFGDSVSDDEKEKLFTKVITKINTKGGMVRGVIADKIFSEEVTKSFIAKCKKYGVSVTAGFFATAIIAASAKKIDAGMPLSFRTKDNWGEVAVSFTDSTFSIDLASALADCEGKDEETIWAAVAKEVHKEIRKKLESTDEKYKGMAVNYVNAALSTENMDSMCVGPNRDDLSITISNVGIMDGYFKDDGPITVTDVTGFCSNTVSSTLVFWCYTYRNKFRVSLLYATYTPRREVFEEFTNKVYGFIEKK